VCNDKKCDLPKNISGLGKKIIKSTRILALPFQRSLRIVTLRMMTVSHFYLPWMVK